jgi:hypothetical protein
MKFSIIQCVTMMLLAVMNAVLFFQLSASNRSLMRTTADLKSATWALGELNAKSSELNSNCVTLTMKANKVGFAASLFGYEACRQGMRPEEFVLLTSHLFRGTNTPEIHIEIDTNAVNAVEDLNFRRRL